MEIGETEMRDERQRREREIKYYSLRPNFFAPFEKSNFLREHHLLLVYLLKMYKFSKLPLKKFIKKLN